MRDLLRWKVEYGLFFLIIFGGIALTSFFVVAFVDVNQAGYSGGYRTDPGDINRIITIDSSNTKKCVTNQSGVAYFVPTRTATEWTSFYNARSGLSVVIANPSVSPNNTQSSCCPSGQCVNDSGVCVANATILCSNNNSYTCNNGIWSVSYCSGGYYDPTYYCGTDHNSYRNYNYQYCNTSNGQCAWSFYGVMETDCDYTNTAYDYCKDGDVWHYSLRKDCDSSYGTCYAVSTYARKTDCSGCDACDSTTNTCQSTCTTWPNTKCVSGTCCQEIAGNSCGDPSNPCLSGTYSCYGVCTDWVALPNGTPVTGGYCVNGNVTDCYTNANCNDNSNCTIDVCQNAGTISGYCNYYAVDCGTCKYCTESGCANSAVNTSCGSAGQVCNGAGSCVTPSCSSNSGCDDGNACTTDTCWFPGSYYSYCENSPKVCQETRICSNGSCICDPSRSGACSSSNAFGCWGNLSFQCKYNSANCLVWTYQETCDSWVPCVTYSPGCDAGSTPFLFTYTDDGYLIENDIMRTFFQTGLMDDKGIAKKYEDNDLGTMFMENDIYKLLLEPKIENNKIKLQLKELQPEESNIDEVKIIKTVHGDNMEVFVHDDGNGKKMIKGGVFSEIKPRSCRGGNGEDCLLEIINANDEVLEKNMGSYVIVEFEINNPNATHYLNMTSWINDYVPKILERPMDEGQSSLSLIIQAWNKNGYWDRLGQDFHPHDISSSEFRLLDLKNDYFDDDGILRLKIDWTARHIIDKLAIVELNETAFKQEVLSVSKALHSSGEDVIGGISDKDNIYAHIVRGEYIDIEFEQGSLEAGKDERVDYFVEVKGYYHGIRTYMYPAANTKFDFYDEVNAYIEELNEFNRKKKGEEARVVPIINR